MDKQNRLTKFSEFKIGGRYNWLKMGHQQKEILTCVDIDKNERCVTLRTEDGHDLHLWGQMMVKRFIEVAP